MAVGAFVVLGVVALVALALQVSNLSSLSGGDGYLVKARFENVGGLKVRSNVSMGGVAVGRVTAIDYDQKTYQAIVSMTINRQYDQIPEDTLAAIYTSGLLGENYVGLEPGGAFDFLAEGGELQFTQSALVLEQVIGQFLFSKAQDGSAATPAPGL